MGHSVPILAVKITSAKLKLKTDAPLVHFVRLVRRLFLALINNFKKFLLEFSTAIIFQIPNPANLPATSAQGHNNMMVQLLVLEAISLFTIVHNSQDVIRELY